MNKQITIRPLKTEEIPILEDMLYEAVYQADETNLIPRDVIQLPEISVYIDNYGQDKNDYCLVATADDKIVGAVWTRILAGKVKGYGNIDAYTPEFAISLFKEYRKQEIGKQLMQQMITYLRKKGFKQTSLSVQKENYAFRLYQKLGFEIIEENKEEFLMLLKL